MKIKEIINEIIIWVSLSLAIIVGVWIVVGDTPPTESFIFPILVLLIGVMYGTNTKLSEHIVESKHGHAQTNKELIEIKELLKNILDELKKK